MSGFRVSWRASSPGRMRPTLPYRLSPVCRCPRHHSPPRDMAVFAASLHSEGQRRADLGHQEQALTCYDQALAIDPKVSRVWNSKGHCLFVLRRYEEAIACYDQALALAPQNRESWDGKGDCLAALGRLDEAIACYDRAADY